MKSLRAVLLISILAWLTPASGQQSRPSLQSFEFLGCSGDWDGRLQKPEVWRATAEGKVTFLVHSVQTCGLTGRSPEVSGSLESLDLKYDLYSPSDSVVFCDCEYWAKFTFGPEAHAVKAVTFSGEQVVLRGSWPER